MPEPPALPVFIVGQPRSGSSILYRLVQTHPRFRPRHGVDLSESAVLDALVRAPALDVHSLRAFAAVDDAGFAEFTAAARRYEGRRQLARRLPRRVLEASPALWAALGCAAVLREYLAVAAAGRGAPRLVEKTPHHLPWVPHLRRAVPDARLLCIARHPLEAYASHRRRAAVEGQGSWASVDVDAYARRWRVEAELILRWELRCAPAFRWLRYEQLVADPDGEQRALFAWLGEPPLGSLPGREEASPFAPAADAPVLYDEIAPTQRDWRAFVPDDEARRLEAAVGDALGRLGYERLAPPP